MQRALAKERMGDPTVEVQLVLPEKQVVVTGAACFACPGCGKGTELWLSAPKTVHRLTNLLHVAVSIGLDLFPISIECTPSLLLSCLFKVFLLNELFILSG